MRHRLALLLAVLVTVLLASLGPVGPAGADDDDDVDPQTVYPLTSFPPPTATTWSCSGTTRPWSASARSGPRRRSTPGACSSSTPRPMTPGRPTDEKASRHPAGPQPAAAPDGVDHGRREPGHQPRRLPGRLLGVARLPGQLERPAGRPRLQHRRRHHRGHRRADRGRRGHRPPHRRPVQPGRRLCRHQRLHPGQPAPAGPAGRPLALAAPGRRPRAGPALAAGDPVQPRQPPGGADPRPPRSVSESVDNIVKESAGLSDRKKSQAVYWADGPGSETPPGHWNLIAQWVSRRHRQSLDLDARMFFALNAGLLDASIACWETKYRWDYARPISLVRHFKKAKTITAWRGPYLGVGPVQGESWSPTSPPRTSPSTPRGTAPSAPRPRPCSKRSGRGRVRRQRHHPQGHLVRRTGHRHPPRGAGRGCDLVVAHL